MKAFWVWLGVLGFQAGALASLTGPIADLPLRQLALYSNVEFSSLDGWNELEPAYIQNGKFVQEQELSPVVDHCAISSIEGPLPKTLPARFQVIEQAVGKTVVRGQMRIVVDVVELTLMSHQNGGHWQMECTYILPQVELTQRSVESIWGSLGRWTQWEEQRLPMVTPGHTAVVPENALDLLTVKYEQDIPLYRFNGSQTVEVLEQYFAEGRVLNEPTSAPSHCFVRVRKNAGESVQAGFQAGGTFDFDAISIRQNRDDYHAESVALVLLGADKKRLMVCRVPLAEAISVEALNRITGSFMRWDWRPE